jgi:hypothetical protein
MTDKHEIKITKNSLPDPLPCSFAPWRPCAFALTSSKEPKEKSEQTKGLPA